MTGAAAAATAAVAVVIAGAYGSATSTRRFFGVRQQGTISAPSEVVRYRFEAVPRTRVFFYGRRAGGECGRNATFTWSLAPTRGPAVFRDRPLYIAGFCSWWGPVVLERGGTYVLTVRTAHGATGAYAFTAWEPRVDEFHVRLETSVTPGSPARGAGRIEVPGSVDRYRFHAPPRTRLFLDARALGASCGLGSVLRWSLYSEFTNTPLVNDALMYSLGTCYDEGPVLLNGGGEYALVVHGRGDSTGRYAFRLIAVPR
jgi:hypothetical protein